MQQKSHPKMDFSAFALLSIEKLSRNGPRDFVSAIGSETAAKASRGYCASRRLDFGIGSRGRGRQVAIGD